MKAVIYSKYGASEVLQLREIEKPETGDHEICMDIHGFLMEIDI